MELLWLETTRLLGLVCGPWAIHFVALAADIDALPQELLGDQNCKLQFWVRNLMLHFDACVSWVRVYVWLSDDCKQETSKMKNVFKISSKNEITKFCGVIIGHLIVACFGTWQIQVQKRWFEHQKIKICMLSNSLAKTYKPKGFGDLSLKGANCFQSNSQSMGFSWFLVFKETYFGFFSNFPGITCRSLIDWWVWNSSNITIHSFRKSLSLKGYSRYEALWVQRLNLKWVSGNVTQQIRQ